MAFLDVRSYDGTPISRRTTDGYVNATAMCKANNKQWNDYFRTDRATQYLEALSAKTGNPVLGPTGLVVANVGGDHSGLGSPPGGCRPRPLDQRTGRRLDGRLVPGVN